MAQVLGEQVPAVGRVGGGDFADYVIGRRGREVGCQTTATFDRRLKPSGLFRLLSA